MATTHLDVCAVVPAAGFGRRMQTECPKQYLSIGNQTILEHSVHALLAHPRVKHVVIAISPGDSRFAQLPLANHPQITVVDGGDERADSVLAGLKAAGDAQWVLVHDAARPCLHQDDLARLLALSETSRTGGILAAPVRDTMKRAEPGKNAIAHTVDRNGLWHALTPQFFPRELLHDCLTRALNEGATITDEPRRWNIADFIRSWSKAARITLKSRARKIWHWPSFTSPEPSIRRIHNANWTRF